MRKQLVVALTLFGLLGCHEPFSNEDLVFLMALPRGLHVDVPKDEGQTTQGLRAAAEGLGEPAQFYLDTRGAAEQINVFIFEFLGFVETVVDLEPTIREDNLRIWGPHQNDGAELRLTMRRVVVDTSTTVFFKATSTSTATEVDVYFEYLLEARVASESLFPAGPWLPILYGQFAPVEAPDSGIGRLVVNFEAIHTLDPNSKERGAFFVGYDTRLNGLEIEFVAVEPNHLPWMEPRIKAAYQYRRIESGKGTLFFAIRENFAKEGPLDELLIVTSRWLPDRRGISFVAMTEGELGGTAGTAVECWNHSFLRTYLTFHYLLVHFEEGAPTSCAPELFEEPFLD